MSLSFSYYLAILINSKFKGRCQFDITCRCCGFFQNIAFALRQIANGHCGCTGCPLNTDLLCGICIVKYLSCALSCYLGPVHSCICQLECCVSQFFLRGHINLADRNAGIRLLSVTYCEFCRSRISCCLVAVARCLVQFSSAYCNFTGYHTVFKCECQSRCQNIVGNAISFRCEGLTCFCQCVCAIRQTLDGLCRTAGCPLDTLLYRCKASLIKLAPVCIVGCQCQSCTSQFRSACDALLGDHDLGQFVSHYNCLLLCIPSIGCNYTLLINAEFNGCCKLIAKRSGILYQSIGNASRQTLDLLCRCTRCPLDTNRIFLCCVILSICKFYALLLAQCYIIRSLLGILVVNNAVVPFSPVNAALNLEDRIFQFVLGCCVNLADGYGSHCIADQNFLSSYLMLLSVKCAFVGYNLAILHYKCNFRCQLVTCGSCGFCQIICTIRKILDLHALISIGCPLDTDLLCGICFVKYLFSTLSCYLRPISVCICHFKNCTVQFNIIYDVDLSD